MTTVKLDGGGIARSTIATRPEDLSRRVNIGVRPEDFEPVEGEGIYTGKVDIVEALGEVTLLYFEAEGGHEPIIAKLPGIYHDRRHSEIKLGADPSKVHLFADGQSLLYR